MRILVTGATGYIGGRLLEELLNGSHRIRVLVRDVERARARPWSKHVDIVQGDLFDPESLRRAVDGVDVAYYLVHSMSSGPDFAARDREAARNFVAAGKHLKQVIYLGGILPESNGGELSQHLSSRVEVGEILREGLPTTEFRAGPIIGGGSASFEMVRYLTERLPAMIAPKWIRNQVRTIAIDDIVSYLTAAIGRPETEGVIDVGTDLLTFRDMMLVYGEVRGLRRIIVPVPVFAPRLAALWVGLVTPIPNSIAVPLIEGVVHPVIGDVARARELFPDITPHSYRYAVSRALELTEGGNIATRWSLSGGSSRSATLEDREGIIRESREIVVNASPAAVFRSFSSIGGQEGWLVWRWAWELRGFLDQLVGGPGLRRGRRHPIDLYPGEALDFWRVEQVEPDRLLRLRAEMKVPGKAWLQFEAVPEGSSTRLVQTAFFAPTGLFGALYWYGLYPIHSLIFSGMAKALATRAERYSAIAGEVDPVGQDRPDSSAPDSTVPGPTRTGPTEPDVAGPDPTEPGLRESSPTAPGVSAQRSGRKSGSH